MFDFSAQQSTTLYELFFGNAAGFGVYSLFASQGKFLIWGGLIVVALLLAFLVVRRRVKTPWRQYPLAASRARSLAANTPAPTARRAGPQGMWRERRRFGLPWKIAKTFAGTTLFVGLVIIGAVYYVLVDAVQRQVNQRALTIATNLSDTAGTYVLAKDRDTLKKVLGKYAQLPEVAYTLVENRQGEVIDSSFKELSSELASLLGGADLRNTRRVQATLGGKKLYDTRVPLVNGEIGAVHVGIWQSAVDKEVNRALIPITGLLLVILVLAVMLAIWIASRISRPILSLAHSTDQISRGDLDLPVGVTSSDELGELSRSIEQLRASLKAAIIRLDRQEF
jgi:methyl-accepting chemotaxis protein